MKPSIVFFVLLGGAIAGAIVYFNRRNPSPAPVVQARALVTNQTAPVVENTAAPAPPPRPIAEKPAGSAVVAGTAPATNDTTALSRAVDTLLSAKNAAQKHELFQELVKNGQIDQVIAELKQRMAANPNDPELPTTLGEAQLNKLRALRDAGGDFNELGILAMQADQSFNDALKIDPQNWEAQIVKLTSMSHWPVNPQIDNQVVQQLSGLIDQQETMPSRPDFAQTYVVLGDEYQKIGQPDKAMATWQLGAQKFPDNTQLQAKISGQ